MKILISIFLVLFLSYSFAQKSKDLSVSKASVSACKTNCAPGYRLFVSEVKGNSYFLEMQIEDECSAYDTVLCYMANDTLIFRIDQKSDVKSYIQKNPDWNKLKKGPSAFSCICTFDISMKLNNISSAPQVLKMDNRYWNGLYFGDLIEYKRHAWKTWADNSAKCSYADFKKCIGNSMYTEEFLDLSAKLGNDSIVEFDNVNWISYPLDNVEINFDASGNVVGIHLTEFFRQFPHPVFFIGNTKEKVDKYLGEPQTFEKGQCISVDSNTGEEKYVDCWLDCYYRNEYIHIRFNKDKKIETITLRY